MHLSDQVVLAPKSLFKLQLLRALFTSMLIKTNKINPASNLSPLNRILFLQRAAQAHC